MDVLLCDRGDRPSPPARQHLDPELALDLAGGAVVDLDVTGDEALDHDRHGLGLGVCRLGTRGARIFAAGDLFQLSPGKLARFRQGQGRRRTDLEVDQPIVDAGEQREGLLAGREDQQSQSRHDAVAFAVAGGLRFRALDAPLRQNLLRSHPLKPRDMLGLESRLFRRPG